jgi:signal transduction histidine kinase
MPLQAKIAEKKQRADKDLAPQAVFDRLSNADDAGAKTEPQRVAARSAMGRVEDLKLDSRQAMLTDEKRSDEKRNEEVRPQAPLLAKSAEQSLARAKRKELTALPELEHRAAAGGAAQFAGAVTTLESELDPFVLRRLDGDHFVLFRKVWLNGARLIQGAVIAQNGLLDGIVAAPFRDTALSQVADLLTAYKGDVIGAVNAAGSTVSVQAAHTDGELLYRTSLSAPLDDVELIFTVTELPVGPGGTIVGWAALILGIVLCAGCVVMYRFGAAQIDLTRAQQNFVSAVSHELKTPLTSIRMYGEILRAGWASEEKKRTYYDFIYHESERLSRLIANVLQLARLTRNGERPEPKRVSVAQLFDLVRSKVAAQVEQAGFQLALDGTNTDTAVVVDADSFVQILINLVDNALKFSARAERKEVEIGCRSVAGRVAFRVRDYGPGIAAQHMKHIFKLFYRAEGELTRETVGTGIGLALVQELTSAMGGAVDVRNCNPGAEFTVTFPVATFAGQPT